MRLGAPVYEVDSPQAWAAAHVAAGYRAAYWPGVPEDQEAAYVEAARAADLVIAEVGAWSNPLSLDAATRAAALEKCKAQLAVADRVGARCCVNIAGSRGEKWDGPCADDLTDATFDLIVETVREIIDAVRPSRTCYTLEPMPWMYPDSAESYLRLLRAVDRPAFGVHLDPVNLVNSPAKAFRTDLLLRECFSTLGPWIKSCHAKDIRLDTRLTVHLDEVVPGQGCFDYRVFLTELAKLDPDMPLMFEHFGRDDYPVAAAHVRAVAAEVGVAL